MRHRTKVLIDTWFEALNEAATDRLLPLFASNPTIRNAADPVTRGPDAARGLLDRFFTRTVSRDFVMIDAAESGSHVFAAWTATLSFAKGVVIDGVTLRNVLSVPLRGIDRFELNGDGLIVGLDIHHETTSVPRAARQAEQERQRKEVCHA